MKKISLLPLIFFLGCADIQTKTVKVCDCEEKIKVTSFIQNSVKNANNMSDEEMEDVIRQLEYTGIRTICSDKLIQFKGCGYGCNNEIVTPLDSCESVYFY